MLNLYKLIFNKKYMKYLISSPRYFGVEYSINPWMNGNKGSVNKDIAQKQWNNLKDILENFVDIDVIPGVKGLPDMVFTANAGIVKNGKVVVSCFKHPERKGEEKYFQDYFEREYGKKNVLVLPKESYQEGAGDALFDRGNDILWCGYGFRSTKESYNKISDFLNTKTVILKLKHPEYYHLDISIAPLDGGYLMYCPLSFTEDSIEKIEKIVPKEKRIILSKEDLDDFNGNAVNIGKNIILNSPSKNLEKDLYLAGYNVIKNNISEFKKAGGGNKCLTLRLE
jgi:N-dimethylarginine dimethylaminohydrolase